MKLYVSILLNIHYPKKKNLLVKNQNTITSELVSSPWKKIQKITLCVHILNWFSQGSRITWQKKLKTNKFIMLLWKQKIGNPFSVVRVTNKQKQLFIQQNESHLV